MTPPPSVAPSCNMIHLNTSRNEPSPLRPNGGRVGACLRLQRRVRRGPLCPIFPCRVLKHPPNECPFRSTIPRGIPHSHHARGNNKQPHVQGGSPSPLLFMSPGLFPPLPIRPAYAPHLKELPSPYPRAVNLTRGSSSRLCRIPTPIILELCLNLKGHFDRVNHGG